MRTEQSGKRRLLDVVAFPRNMVCRFCVHYCNISLAIYSCFESLDFDISISWSVGQRRLAQHSEIPQIRFGTLFTLGFSEYRYSFIVGGDKDDVECEMVCCSSRLLPDDIRLV
jgi:hypothetical protein